jgi:hypothetical protein
LYIDVDTSKKGIGIMAFHVIGDHTNDKEVHKQSKIHPIMFLSWTLTPAETRYWPTELEVAGVVWAVSKLRHLINSSSRPTIIYTDNSVAIWIARQTSLPGRTIRHKDLTNSWILKSPPPKHTLTTPPLSHTTSRITVGITGHTRESEQPTSSTASPGGYGCISHTAASVT